MRRHTRRSFGWLVWVLAAIAACTPGPSSDVAEFPIIGNDPDRLVEGMDWGVSPTDADLPRSDGERVIEVLDDSTSEIVRVAVEGGTCPPSAQVQVTGEPDMVVIEMVLGGSVEPPGEVCGDILTTHELIIRFKEPINLDRLSLSGRYTEGA